MKKTLLLLVFIFTCAFTYNVNAVTLSPRSALDSYANNNVFDTTGIVDSDQRPQENFTYSSTLNTTYSRKLFGLRAYFNYSLTANHTYRLSIYTALNNFNSTSFNYTDLHICYGSSWSGANSNCTTNLGYSILSSDTIAFNFRPTSNYTYFSIRIGPQTMTSYPLTNDFTYRITSFTLDDLSGPVNNPSNQDVINNDNQNTQIIQDNVSSWGRSILNNEYQGRMEILESLRNTQQTILNNQNQNSEEIINSINNIHEDLVDCISSSWHVKNNSTYINPDLVDRYLESDGSIGVSAGYAISKYLTILPNTHYFLNTNDSNPRNVYFCLYDSSLTVLSCTKYNQQSTWSFTTPDNAKSIRFTIRTNNPDYELILDSGQICTNKLDTINDSINGIHDYISDGNVSSSTGQNFFGNFQVNDFGISAIVSAPLNAISSLTSATCSPLIIPIPFTNSTVSLPCMTSYYSSKVPELYQLWQIVSFGIISYYIINSIFGMIHNFREPDNDCVEVLDL